MIDIKGLKIKLDKERMKELGMFSLQRLLKGCHIEKTFYFL